MLVAKAYSLFGPGELAMAVAFFHQSHMPQWRLRAWEAHDKAHACSTTLLVCSLFATALAFSAKARALRLG